MPLKDVEIQAIRPAYKPVKVADGKGLYVEVFPNGSKLWRLKYRIAGKEKRQRRLGSIIALSGLQKKI